MPTRHRAVAATGWLAAAVLAGCASVPGPVWQEVSLPAGVRPASLAALGDDLLVGGQRPSGAGPYLGRLDASGRLRPVELVASGGYAAAADLVLLSPDGANLRALGVARGGAHGNQRWTFWQGPVEGPVRDVEQPFSTFGGHEAGPLLGIVGDPGHPVVVGSRAGIAGFDAALWTLNGSRWSREPALDPVLRSNPDRALTFRAAGSRGDLVLIAGAETGLAGEVLQQPMLWSGRLAGTWRALPLELPEQLATATGLAQATAVTCGSADCWAAGRVRGSPVVWQVDPAAGRSRGSVLPGGGGKATDPLVLVALAGDTPVVVADTEPPIAAWLCDGQWRTSPAPPGRTTALAAVGDRLYALTTSQVGASLWWVPARAEC